MFDPEGLLGRLSSSGVRYVVVGGVAVGFHGAIRATDDLDVCPQPSPENLARLARLLEQLNASQKDTGDFDAAELPFDPTSVAALAQGGNFRLETALGGLDILQWIPGIDADHAFPVLERDAEAVDWHGHELLVCSLAHLRRMKRIAGRPRDLQDLADLDAAYGRESE